MPDLDSQILTKLGSMEEKINGLKQTMDGVCDFKDEVSKIAQEFLLYKEERRDLPARLQRVETRSIDTEKEFKEHCRNTAWIAEKVAKSDNYFKAAILAWGIVVSVVALMVTLGKYLGITFVIK